MTYRNNLGKKCDASDKALEPQGGGCAPPACNPARRHGVGWVNPEPVGLPPDLGVARDQRRQRAVRARHRQGREGAQRRAGRRRVRVLGVARRAARPPPGGAPTIRPHRASGAERPYLGCVPTNQIQAPSAGPRVDFRRQTEEVLCRLGVYRVARNTYQRLLNTDYYAGRVRDRDFFRGLIPAGGLVFDVGANEGRLTRDVRGARRHRRQRRAEPRPRGAGPRALRLAQRDRRGDRARRRSRHGHPAARPRQRSQHRLAGLAGRRRRRRATTAGRAPWRSPSPRSTR